MESILARSFLILFLLPVAGRCQEIVGAGTTPVGNFDVLAKSYDPNGFPMNPFWRWQSIADNEHLAPDPSILCASGLPDGADCTTQKTWENLPHIPKIFICMWQLQSRLIGHINWTPATYDGGILWKEKTPDEDCNFATKPINNNGLTRGSMTSEFGYLGLEFDSRETVQRMHSEPWATLWSQVSTGKSSDQVNNWLATHLSNAQWPYMVVTGLFGVDCEHDCHTELHPVFEMAIQIDPRPDDNTWGIMVRNWGNEGFCAHGQVNLSTPQNQIAIFLPHAGKKPEVLSSTKFFATDSAVVRPDITFVSDPAAPGLLVTFRLPDAFTKPIEELELHLKWADGTFGPSPGPKSVSVATPSTPQPRSVEQYLEKLNIQGGTANSPMVSSIGTSEKSTKRIDLPVPYPIKELIHLVRTPVSEDKVTFTEVTDVEEERRDTQLFESLCKQYNDKPAGIPEGACQAWLSQNKK